MISLCLCTFNGAQFLKNQLDSILNGTLLPDEIIIFDDYSSDGTLEILKQYKKSFSNISWSITRRDNNVGWRINFHDAINKATGDIIFLADQDDIWMKDKIETMYNAMKSNNSILLLSCKYIIQYDNSKKNHRNPLKQTKEIRFVKPNSKHGFLGINPGCTYCFKRELVTYFNDVWFPENAHDRVLWTCAFLRRGLAIIDYYGIQWCRHTTSASLINSSIFSEKRYDYKIHEIKMNLLTSNYMKNYIETNNLKSKIIESFYKCNVCRFSYFKRPTLIKYLSLIRFISVYPSFFSYLLDSIALFRRKRKE